MSDDQDNTPPPDPRSASAFTPELEAELYALVDSLLDDSIAPAQLLRLEAIVIEHRSAAVLYYQLVHLWCILPFHLSNDMIDLTEPGGTPDATATTMNESMVLPAIRRGDVGGIDDALEMGPAVGPLPAPARPAPKKPIIWWLSGAAAAILLIGVGIMWHAWHRPAEMVIAPVAVPPPVVEAPVAVPPATLTATAGAEFEGDAILKPGTALADGDTVRLTQGAVELTFASSAVVVVRGPARVRVVDGKGLAMEAGAVTAHVPTAAHGFRVDSPGSSVVDLGTDFGVRSVVGSAQSEVDVFNGLVDAVPLDAAGQQISKPVRVVAGSAVQLRVADPVPVLVAFAPAKFDRDIKAIRMPVPFHGTGVGVKAGAPDENWQVVSVPGDPAWKAKPAVVVSSPWHKYAPNTPEGSWISLTDPQQDVANGEYVFETTVDLSGVDPKTLSAQVRFAVDNQVTDVRVNGVSTRASTQKMKADDDFAGYSVTLPATAPWHTGLNRVDVVLLNDSFDGSDKPSFMGMQAAWTATASPVVLR